MLLYFDVYNGSFNIIDPEFGGAFVMLPLGFLGWYLCLFIYLDCKNFLFADDTRGYDVG